MENVNAFDVMYEVEAPVANTWEARMVAQGLLSRDMNHGPEFAIDGWDAETDSVQFRVLVNGDFETGYFHEALGARSAEVAQ